MFVIFYKSAPNLNGNADPRPRPTLRYLASRFHEPYMRAIMWSATSLVAVQYGVVLYNVLFFRDAHGVSVERAARFFIIYEISGLIGRVLLAGWSDKSQHGRFPLVLGGMLAAVIGLSALMLIPSDAPEYILAVGSDFSVSAGVRSLDCLCFGRFWHRRHRINDRLSDGCESGCNCGCAAASWTAT